MIPQSLPELVFPAPTRPSSRIPEALREQGFELRSAESRDIGFMRNLYATLRAEEMALVAWPEATRGAFLDSQFTLQHQHFITHFAQAEFLMLEHHRAPVGRLYVLRTAPRWSVIDIALLPARQGHGVGGALLRQLQQDARDAGVQGLSLHVRLDNPRAHALYVRLGFRHESVDGMHLLMHWDTPPQAQLNTA